MKVTLWRESQLTITNVSSSNVSSEPVSPASRFELEKSGDTRSGEFTGVTKHLCKVLLGPEATGHGHVQAPRTGGTNMALARSTFWRRNKLMRGFAR